MSFSTLNGFVKSADGVYRKGDPAANTVQKPFNYSDGADAEQALHQILSSSKDLSSDSPELNAQVFDWPSEYHLSSVRANLLRALDLKGMKRVLELGCGCGSITRYLGEQSHLQIDAIEGSEARAGLAALRCKGLGNVSISTANFNEVVFPENYYDLVLYVGVTEYAGRFSQRETDQQALQDLLALAKKATTDNGTVLIAIENRLGLKYLLGACEDHYGVPYIGVNNYPESTGIRTYSKKEWQHEIEVAGFARHQFLFPFPDYKLPTLVLLDDALCNDALTESLIEKVAGLRSRDYLQKFDMGEREAPLWQAMLQNGNLGDYANSFLILLGKQTSNREASEALIKSSICEFVDPALHLNYAAQDQAANDFEVASGSIIQKHTIESVELRSQLAVLGNKAEALQNQLDLIYSSRVWRWRNRLRLLLASLGLIRK